MCRYALYFFEPGNEFVQLLHCFLQGSLALARSLDEDDVLRLLACLELAAKLFEVPDMDFIAVMQRKRELFLGFAEKGRKLCHELGFVFKDSLLPDKFILVGERLNLCSVNEDVFKGNDTELFKQEVHLGKQFLDAECQMFGTES